MEDFISILVLIILGLAPTIIKVIKEKGKVVTPSPVEESEFEDSLYETDATEDVPKMRQTVTNSPNDSDYFTYETIDPEDDSFSEKEKSTPVNFSQTTDNEVEKMPQLNFDEEELYKGVIYSEILKRKYN
ncbi:MAG: hypothetical protein J5799_05180 [Bacteroidales bacterium]|nr:hypothetical protein [Bacteroidales bacterium]